MDRGDSWVKLVKTSTPIDDLTGGGLEQGTLILIYGPTGCGKTTLCLKIAENLHKLEEGYSIVYIDTEGGAPEVEGVRMMRVRSLREQGELLKNLRKEGLSRAMIILDSMTAQYHRQVLSAPAQFRAGTAAELGGVIAKHINWLRDIVEGTESIAVLTAHLKSPVENNFKMNMLRRMAKAWKQGRYTPTAGDYMYFSEDTVKWIGGRALGMHVHRRLRIFVDDDGSRILYIEKWPLKYPYCIRYVMDKAGNLQKIGGLFDLEDQMRNKLYSLEFKTMLGEVLEASEKEGVVVEEGEEEAVVKKEKKQEEKQRKQKPKPGELKFPKVPTLGDIAEEEKSKGGRADESSDSDSDGEGSGGRQE
jgi:energy-coupling factor transporter ATP-binding protein EcfA2